MRIGLIEFLLILAIASLTVGPRVALFVDRWMRRANRANAMAARRRAEYAAQMAAERDAMLKRFRTASTVFGVGILLALVYALVFRPIDTPPKTYAAPERAERAEHVRSVDPADALNLSAYEIGTAIRMQDGWLYAAAKLPKAGVLMRMQPDGSGMNEVLDVAGGEITDLAFAPDGTLWMTTIEADGGKLCRVSNDQWGVTVEPVVTQIDGKALSCPAAVAVGADGKVYFTNAADVSVKYGLESALRTELLAHTATGWVYVYDPVTRAVERVLGGVAGASGLALSADGGTLYVSDLGSRCIWAVDAAARELTAGGRGCTAAFAGLPGYPGALAVDTDGTLYISYRWARSGWLEKNADSTLLRGIALRAGQNTQERLFRCTADAPCAEAVSLATGTWEQTFTGLAQDSCAAVCPVESKVYFGAAGADSLLAANR